MKKNIFAKTVAVLATAAVLGVASTALSVSAAATPSVTLSNVTAKAGETVTIAMAVDGNSDFSLQGFGGVVSYDSALKYVDSDKNGTMMDIVNVSPDTTIAVGASSMEGTTKNGTIVSLQFTVPEDATAGTVYAIKWDSVQQFNDGTNEIATSVGKVDGSITVAGEETTAAETTAAPEETTAAPAETTAAPAETTVAPETTKAVVKATTKAAATVKESPKTGSTGIAATAAVLLAAACSAVVLKKKNK